MLIIRRVNCINTISGICHSDRLVCRLGSKPAHQTVTYIERHILDIVLIQLAPDDEHLNAGNMWRIEISM